jgi:hypothetical protein
MATTVAQDSFTEEGSGTAALTTHTPEVGTAWTLDYSGVAGGLLIDKTNDRVSCPIPPDSSGEDGGGWGVVSPDVTGEVDVYLTSDDGYYCGPVVRRVSSTTHYRIWANKTALYLYRRTSGADTVIASVSKLSGATKFRLQASGVSPTTLRVKAWLSSGSEPEEWGIDTTDNTAANQNAIGKVGISASSYDDGEGYVGGAKVDDFLATTPSADMYSPAVTLALTGMV